MNNPNSDLSPPSWSDDAVLAKSLRAAGLGHVVFGRFRLERELDRSESVAWLAKDEQLENQLVVLKFLGGHLAREAERLAALQREIREHLSVDHPGVVRLYDLHQSPGDGLAAISMEWVEGPTLGDLQAEQPDRCFNPPDLLPWLRQICETLTYLHAERGIVHRELIPGNIILAGRGRLKLADVGIVAAIDALWARNVGYSAGAPGYLCPQQVEGQLGQMSDDIYCVGALFYELLSGKPPFHGGSPELLRFQLVHDLVPSIEDRRSELRNVGHPPISIEWEAALASCLVKAPHGRPGSAAQLFKRIAEPHLASAADEEINPYPSKSTVSAKLPVAKASVAKEPVAAAKSATPVTGVAPVVAAASLSLVGAESGSKRGPLPKGARISGAAVVVQAIAEVRAADAPEFTTPRAKAAPVAALKAVPASSAVAQGGGLRPAGRLLLAVGAIAVLGVVGAVVVSQKKGAPQDANAGLNAGPTPLAGSATPVPVDASALAATQAAAQAAAQAAKKIEEETARVAAEKVAEEERRAAAEKLQAEERRVALELEEVEQKRVAAQKLGQMQLQKQAEEQRRQLARTQADESYKRENYATALTLYSEAAALKDPWSCFRLGKIYAEGFGVAPERKKAAEFFQKASTQGVPLAQYSLGLLYASGQGVVKDDKKAVELFRSAAGLLQGTALGDEATAQWTLGVMYAKGRGVARDEAKAAELFQKAALQGELNAMVHLAEMYCEGQGVARDEKKAVELYKKAAAQGDARAQSSLGQLFESGRGLPKDNKKAQELYKQALFLVLHDAALGDPLAEFNLAVMYGAGRGVPKDEKKAVELYQKAAAQNESDAQLNLGAVLLTGQGVPKDLKKGAELLEQASAQGNQLAKLNLGWLYETGQGVPKDPKKAVELYTQASESGLLLATQALGRLSGTARGVVQEKPVMAMGWRQRMK